MWMRFFVLVFATCLCRRSHVRCSKPCQWSIYCPDWLSSAPIKFCGIKKNDLMIAYSLFRTGELFIMTAISISSKLYCMVLFWVFCFPKYVCKWKGKSCLKGRITQALYQRKESWRYIDAAPVHSSSVAFVISQHLLELCYTMENLSAVTLCGYSFTFSSIYFILLYSCCL